MKCVRLACQGEKSDFVETVLLPKSDPIFASVEKNGTCPVLKLIGHPICMKKISPRTKLTAISSGDNMWATGFAIDPATGLAPRDWLPPVGPVLLFRPDFTDLETRQVADMYDFVSDLLDKYGDNEVKVSRDITPHAYSKFLQSRS